ncbi:hypothetical protein GQ607_012846 [Colletotrichum asianum]|uniref:F-box domain-containing protein n=1 Tax=Colletotrichum asianum TaxID=702518 RepID=A0A8H3W2C6_9PEZI|nr:hypothetical protein GQ607_012846 [Colletotrichum asianum]
MDAPIKHRDDMAKARDSVKSNGLQNSLFANLPMEILLQILGDIRPYGRFALSQTCRDLRYLTHKDWNATYAKFSQEMQVEFLADLTSTQPNRWLCTICLSRHTARDFRDIEENFHPELRCLNKQRKGHTTHAHIQLATKAVRLQHLLASELRPEALLKPWSLPQIRSPRLELEPLLKAVPKVVDGRFLLFVEFNFVWDSRQEAPALTDILQCHYPFCAHLDTDACQIPYCTQVRTNPSEASHYGKKPLFGLSADNKYFEQLVDNVDFMRHVTYVNGRLCHRVEIRSPDSPDTDLMETIDKAFEETGQEFQGQCHICLTDYSILVESGRLICRAWTDYGTGNSPMEDEWQVQFGRELIIPHLAGSVRRRYEKQASAFQRRAVEGSIFG